MAIDQNDEMAPFLHYAKTNGVATITLDNPPVNVLTPAIHRRLYCIIKDFVEDPEVRVGIWTSAGSRIMSAGDDIKTPRSIRTDAETIARHLSPRQNDEQLGYPGWENEVMKIERYKPIVAAINGPVYGGAMLYLLMLTDIRITVDNAVFCLPEIKFGMGGASGMMRLSRQLPHAVAMNMALTGEPLSADDALRHGLVTEIVPSRDLMRRANEIAGKIAASPPIGVRAEMEASLRGEDMSRGDAFALASHLFRMCRVGSGNTLPLSPKKGADSDD